MKCKPVLRRIFFLTGLLGGSVPVFGQGQPPADKPVAAKSAEGLNKFEEAIAPYVKKARETLPKAKKRYLKGLPKGEQFFVTIRLYGPDGKYEQVFVKVPSWKKEEIKGLLASTVHIIPNHKPGEKITYREAECHEGEDCCARVTDYQSRVTYLPVPNRTDDTLSLRYTIAVLSSPCRVRGIAHSSRLGGRYE